MWPELQDDHLENSRKVPLGKCLINWIERQKSIFLIRQGLVERIYYTFCAFFTDKHDIIIDKVAASHDNSHIVAVTSNNMVCIWKRTDNSDGGNDSNTD